MLRKSVVISLAVFSLMGFAALAQVDPGPHGPQGTVMAQIRSLPELIRAIAQEVKGLEDALQGFPALKEELARPLGIIDKVLEELKAKSGAGEGAVAKELIVLDLALHRLNEVSAIKGIQARIRSGPKGTMGPRPTGRGTAVSPELRARVEAYLKGAAAALSPEEAAKLQRIVHGLMEEVRGTFPHGARPQRAPQAPERMELGKHFLKLRALTAQLDRLLLGRLLQETGG